MSVLSMHGADRELRGPTLPPASCQGGVQPNSMPFDPVFPGSRLAADSATPVPTDPTAVNPVPVAMASPAGMPFEPVFPGSRLAADSATPVPSDPTAVNPVLVAMASPAGRGLVSTKPFADPVEDTLLPPAQPNVVTTRLAHDNPAPSVWQFPAAGTPQSPFRPAAPQGAEAAPQHPVQRAGCSTPRSTPAFTDALRSEPKHGSPSAANTMSPPVFPQKFAAPQPWSESYGFDPHTLLEKGRLMMMSEGMARALEVNEAITSFPLLFTIFCCVIFVIPLWLTDYIGQDRHVRFWITDSLRLVCFVPIAFVIAHIWHVITARPNRCMVALCTICPCAVLLILGDAVLLQASFLGNGFIAKDCTTLSGKRMLEAELQTAQQFYNVCLENTAKYTRSTPEAAASLYRIQDCTGYEEKLLTHPSWEYLGWMEEELRCSGWCTRSPPLWTNRPFKDSCSSAVADIMYNKVQWTMLQVVAYTIICLVFVTVALLLSGPMLRSKGIKF